jgi:rare lipoprotein A
VAGVFVVALAAVQEENIRPFADRVGVHAREGGDHRVALGYQALRLQDGGAHDEEGQRAEGVDKPGEHGVLVHDADPAVGPPHPRLAAVRRARPPGVALLDAPVSVEGDLVGPDTGDPEHGDGRAEGAGGDGEGEAAEALVSSWYGPGLEGNLTASGEVFDPYYDYTAASLYYPMGTEIEVCYADCAVVRVNDLGPYVGGRDLDLSQAAAEDIGLTAVGTDVVDVRVLE